MSDVFDFFGDEEIDPTLQHALDTLRDAVQALPGRSGGFTREPDLSAVSDAVRGVLEAMGDGVAVGAAEDWKRYEDSDREASRRQTAWAMSDAIFRFYMDGSGKDAVTPVLPTVSKQRVLHFNAPPQPDPEPDPDDVPPPSDLHRLPLR
jgi:hypothetical protein